MRRDLATLHACNLCILEFKELGGRCRYRGGVWERNSRSEQPSSCVPWSHVSVTPTPHPPFTSVVQLDVFSSFFLSCGPSFHRQGFKFSPEAARSKLGEVLRCDARSRQGLPVPGNRTDQDLPTLFCRLGPKLSPRCEAVEVSKLPVCLLPVCLDVRSTLL